MFVIDALVALALLALSLFGFALATTLAWLGGLAREEPRLPSALSREHPTRPSPRPYLGPSP